MTSIAKKSLGLVALFICGVIAQEAPLTLQACMQRVLAENRDLANAKMNKDIAQESYRAARGHLLPQVNTNAFVQKYFAQPPVNPYNPTFKYVTSIGADVSIPIIAPAAWPALASAKEDIQTANLTEQDAQNQMAQGAASLFIAIQSLQQQLVIVDLSLRQMDELIAQAKVREAGGAGRHIDTERLQVNREGIEKQRRALDLQNRNLISQLKLALNTPANQSLVLAQPDTIADTAAVIAMLAESKTKNCSDVISVKRLESSLASQESKAKAADLARWPMLFAYGAWSNQGVGNSFSLTNPEQGYFNTVYAGVQLRFSVLDGGQTSVQANQASLAVKMTRNQLDYAKEHAQSECEDAQHSLTSALEDLWSAETNLQLSLHVFELMRVQYEAGVVSTTDVMDVERSLREARIQKVNAQLAVSKNQIGLEAAQDALLARIGK